MNAVAGCDSSAAPDALFLLLPCGSSMNVTGGTVLKGVQVACGKASGSMPLVRGDDQRG